MLKVKVQNSTQLHLPAVKQLVKSTQTREISGVSDVIPLSVMTSSGVNLFSKVGVAWQRQLGRVETGDSDDE